MSVDAMPYRLDDETVDALCASAEARALLHPDTEVDTGALRRAADALISGRCGESQLKRLDAMIEGTPRLLPPGFTELFTHIGINPRGVLAILHAIPEHPVAIFDHAGPVARLDYNQSDMTWIRLGDRDPDDEMHTAISWRDTELVVPALPETVAGMLEGRPLEAVIDHPALRPLGLTITKVRGLWEDDGYMEVETSLHTARQEDEDVVTRRVQAMLAEIVGDEGELAAMDHRPMHGGTDATGIMYGSRGTGIAVNPELVRLHDDDELRILLLRLIDEWRETR